LLYPEYWSDSIDILSDRAKKKLKNMTYILSEILARSKQREIEVAMVLIPSQFHYNPKSHRVNNPWIVTGTEIRKEWLSEDTEIQRKMRLWARLEGVPFLDLTVAFRTAIHENANVDWELDDHWNRLGHQVAAKAIASWLNDQQVFSFMKSKRQTSQ
jgi:lysophospholipase L1-like esterase